MAAFCEDCMIKDTRTCAIAVQCVDGGRVRNLRFRRITIQNVESVFFIMIADKGRTPDWGTRRIGSVEEITFEWIEAERVRRPYGCYLGGYRTPGGEVHTIRDIYFHGVNAIYEGGRPVPAAGICRPVPGIQRVWKSAGFCLLYPARGYGCF